MSAVAVLSGQRVSNAYQGDTWNDVKSRIAGEALTNGLIVYDDPTTAKVKISDATTSSTTQQVYGMVIEGSSVGAGQAVTVMRRGVVAGWDLSAINAGALIYLSTAGGIDTAPNGTKTVVIGKVVGSERLDYAGNVVKFLEVDFATLSVIT